MFESHSPGWQCLLPSKKKRNITRERCQLEGHSSSLCNVADTSSQRIGNRRWCWNNRRETRISIGAPSIRVPGPRSRIFPRIFLRTDRETGFRRIPREISPRLSAARNVFQRSTRIIFVTLVTRTKEILLKEFLSNFLQGYTERT